MTWPLILGYFVLQLLIGLWVSRWVKNEDDYLVAGRSQPAWTLAVSLFATWFGAETCIGSSAAVYAEGLSGSRADPLGYSLCLLLGGLLIAVRIWNRKYSTLADFYADRFGKGTERLATAILCLSSLIWGAAQIRAFGQVISATTPLDVQTAIFLSFIFVVAYTLLGGLLGDIITDVVQGFVLVAGLILILVLIGRDADIPGILAEQDAQRLSLLAQGETFWERLDRWMVPVMGSLVAQEVVARMLAAKSGQVARSACYAACGIYLLIGSIPVILGLIGPRIFPHDGEAEQFLIQLAQAKLPTIAFVAFSGALISALLATIDSILLGVGGLVAHNMIIPAMKITDQKTKLWINRSVVVLAGAVCYVTAMYSTSIYDLLETASSFGTAGIVVITVFGLWMKTGKNLAAAATLIAGLVFKPVAESLLGLSAPFVATIGLCLAVFAVSSYYETRRDFLPNP